MQNCLAEQLQGGIWDEIKYVDDSQSDFRAGC